jgi:hypothetical protein
MIAVYATEAQPVLPQSVGMVLQLFDIRDIFSGLG